MIKQLYTILFFFSCIHVANGQQASVRFVLNDTFQSVKRNFKDSALKALRIEAEVLSSQEFKDSLIKYTFSCKNNTVSPCDCLHENNTCNEAVRIPGLTVYNALLRDSVVNIKLIVAKASFRLRHFSKTYGSSCPCYYITTTYTWWLANDDLPLTYYYAAHLAHEYAHITGYIHGDQPLSDDVAYVVGNIVENILKRRAGVL